MYDVMVDLETAGTRPGCAIFSIGAVEFDPHGTEVKEDKAFYRVVSLQSCLEAGLQVDANTIYWWLGQGDAARKALLQSQVDLRPAICQFTTWFGTNPASIIWSHGATFDLPILDAAYHAVGQRIPWLYRNARDTRTLFAIAPNYYDTVASAVSAETKTRKHNALNDAIEQAKWVQRAYAKLKEASSV